jgi:hypothetical protein
MFQRLHPWRQPWKEFQDLPPLATLGHPWGVQASHSRRMKYMASYRGGASLLAPAEGYLLRKMQEVVMNGTYIYSTHHQYSILYQQLWHSKLQLQQDSRVKT